MIENKEELTQALKDAVTKNRKRFMALGVLSLVLGVVGLFISVAVTIATTILFGLFMVMLGVLFLVEAFAQEGMGSKVLTLIVGALYIMGGAAMTIHPGESAVWLTLVMSVFFVVIGISKIVVGFMARKESSAWGTIVFNGALGLILGVMVYNDWPESGLWVIGTFVSIEMIMQGITVIGLSKGAKDVQESVEA